MGQGIAIPKSVTHIPYTSFGVLTDLGAAVAGSNPAGMFALAVFGTSLVALTGQKIKGGFMSRKNFRLSISSKIKPAAPKCEYYFRRIFGESLIVLAAIFASMTAADAGQSA